MGTKRIIPSGGDSDGLMSRKGGEKGAVPLIVPIHQFLHRWLTLQIPTSDLMGLVSKELDDGYYLTIVVSPILGKTYL